MKVQRISSAGAFVRPVTYTARLTPIFQWRWNRPCDNYEKEGDDAAFAIVRHCPLYLYKLRNLTIFCLLIALICQALLSGCSCVVRFWEFCG